MCLGASLTFDGGGRALGALLEEYREWEVLSAEEAALEEEEEEKNRDGEFGGGGGGGGDGGGSRIWYLNGQDRLWEWRVVD
jgi:hypothetical protein